MTVLLPRDENASRNDSERMADVLAPIGYAPVEAPDHADLVILNTCHIRDGARPADLS